MRPHGLYSPWNSPGQNPGVGNCSLLQGIFPTQESNPGLPHCRQILYQLSHKGSPKILEWVFAMFISVQSLSHVRLFATLWTAAHQGSLFFTNSWSLGKLMSIELVIPSNHFILCHPLSSCLQSCPVMWSFLMSQFFTSVGQSIGGSISASVLPMNIQD